VFPVRYKLDSYIVFRRYSVFIGLSSLCPLSVKRAAGIRSLPADVTARRNVPDPAFLIRTVLSSQKSQLQTELPPAR
jgi:hypothetical protein